MRIITDYQSFFIYTGSFLKKKVGESVIFTRLEFRSFKVLDEG